MVDQSLVSGAMADALAANRLRLNALYAQASLGTSLDADTFKEYLRQNVAPVVDAVARVRPEAVNEVMEILFGFALDLCARELPARYPALGQGMRLLLSSLPRPVAEAPRRFAGSVLNALYNLSTTPDAKPVQWIQQMIEIAPRCGDASTLLDAGKVVAWRAGMAHYRLPALEVARKLPTPAAHAALGLPPVDSLSISEALVRLQEDPWIAPSALHTAGGEAKLGLRMVARAGAFRGFGGLFSRPPFVMRGEDGLLYVGDGTGLWMLHADVFGALFTRAEGGGMQMVSDNTLGAFTIDRVGRVSYSSPSASSILSAEFPELSEPLSAVAVGKTLAVTTPISHAVYLVSA